MNQETRIQIEQYKTALGKMYRMGLDTGIDYYIDAISDLRR